MTNQAGDSCLCSNSLQMETRATKDKLHIIHPEVAENDLNSDAGASLCALQINVLGEKF